MKPELPSSDAFWILSSAYRDAGNSALATIRTGTYTGLMVMPCVFLFFRSVELAIKSVLVIHGVTETEIARKLGRRISDLMSRVEQLTELSSIGMQPNDRDLLNQYSDDYANKWFEYSDYWCKYPELDVLRDLAQRICDAVQNYKLKGA